MNTENQITIGLYYLAAVLAVFAVLWKGFSDTFLQRVGLGFVCLGTLAIASYLHRMRYALEDLELHSFLFLGIGLVVYFGGTIFKYKGKK